MSEHEQYMTDFMEVFAELDRWGPGRDADTLRALSAVPTTPKNIIDIGCGKGFSTRLLAEHTAAQIVALDTEPGALDDLDKYLASHDLKNRVTLSYASMTELPFPEGCFDLIWAEASAYIMGVERALSGWRTHLSEEGYLVISDLVWLVKKPHSEAQTFWNGEYPDMQRVEVRLNQMQKAGFKVIDHFTLSEQAWSNYYQPLKLRVTGLKNNMPESLAITDIEREIDIYERFLGEFGYQFFILKNN